MNLIWLFPALVFLSILAKPFFTIWAGKDFGEQSVLPFYILLAGLVFNIPAYLPYSAIMASGRTDVFAKLYIAELIPYIGLVGILTYKFGIVGAACAWSTRIGADAWLQFYLAHKTADVKFLGISSAFALAVAVLIVPLVLNLLFPAATVVVLGVFFVSAVVYVILLWKTVLQADEIAWLLGRVRPYFGA
jgi:O-antigen/teichoic acid export membrane protein